MATKTTEKSPAQAALERRQAEEQNVQALAERASSLSNDAESIRSQLQNLIAEQSGQRYAAAHGEATAVDPSLRTRIAALEAELEEKLEMLSHLAGSRKAASDALDEAKAAHDRAVGDEKEREYVARIAELNAIGREYEAAWASALAAFEEARRYKEWILPALEVAKRELLQHPLTFPWSRYTQIRLPNVGTPRHL